MGQIRSPAASAPRVGSEGLGALKERTRRRRRERQEGASPEARTLEEFPARPGLSSSQCGLQPRPQLEVMPASSCLPQNMAAFFF